MYLIVALVFLVVALYYWRRAKIVEKQLEFEMADVRNVAQVRDYDRAVQIVQQERAERYKSLVSSSENTNSNSY